MKETEKRATKQNHFKTIIFIILGLLILTTITMGIFSFLNKPKVVETKTFSEIPGFSFEYPVFKSYELSMVNKINDGQFNIVNSLMWQSKEKIFNDVFFVNIGVKKEDNNYAHEVHGMRASVNPNNVEYYPIGGYDSTQSGSLVFFNPDQKYVVMIRPISQGLSIDFPDDVFSRTIAKKIIETFKFDSTVASGVSAKAEYGKKVKYELNKTIEFPDFTLKFKGTTKKIDYDNTKLEFGYYNFEVTSENKSQKIDWSSGTGIIGPIGFTVDGKKFMLERIYAKNFEGQLKDDELIVTPESEYQK
jgi:hypothetical protein